MKTACAAIALSLCMAAAAPAGQVITIMQKTASIRSAQQFFAKPVATVGYGTQLNVLEEKEGWYKVSIGEQTGWVHGSSAAKGAVAVSAKAFDKGASREDVALAGKGFNEQVEGKYKKDHPELNFAAVDKMEKITVDEAALARFVADGKLGGAVK